MAPAFYSAHFGILPTRLPRPKASRVRCLASGTPVSKQLRIATRGSKLALEQARQVQAALEAAAVTEGMSLKVEMVVVETRGDIDKNPSLRAMGSGAFTEEVDAAVVSGHADVAVHSLKDAPPVAPDGLMLGACLPREDVRDAVILRHGYTSLWDLPAGSKVGTSSSRRKAQILARHSKLQVVPLRGSVEARLAAIAEGRLDATVLALSGLNRLGKAHLASEVLDTSVMLPAACQGAIGAMCRKGDEDTIRLLMRLCHLPTLVEVTCERGCLELLMACQQSGLQFMPDFAVACHAIAVSATAATFSATAATAADESAPGIAGRTPKPGVANAASHDVGFGRALVTGVLSASGNGGLGGQMEQLLIECMCSIEDSGHLDRLQGSTSLLPSAQPSGAEAARNARPASRGLAATILAVLCDSGAAAAAGPELLGAAAAGPEALGAATGSSSAGVHVQHVLAAAQSLGRRYGTMLAALLWTHDAIAPLLRQRK